MTRNQSLFFGLLAAALLIAVTWMQVRFGGSPYFILSAALCGGLVVAALRRPS